ncbi:phage holin [Staphylococcus aureus]
MVVIYQTNHRFIRDRIIKPDQIQASAIIGAILTLLTGIGVITDPTSKGVSNIHL